MITVLSLFTGLGGLDLGLEAAGLDTVGYAEIDECACLSLKANRGDEWPQLPSTDVSELARTLTPERLGLARGELDLLAGAPPCQPFSRAAEWSPTSRAGLSDDRGLLIFDVLELIKRFAPRVVLLENVAGFVSGRTSVLPVLQRSQRELEQATGYSYELDHRVVDAHEYGVPQHRRRAIIVLSRVGEFPWPEPDAEAKRPRAWDAIGELEGDDTERPTMRGKWAALLPSIPEGWNYQWHTSRGGGQRLFGYRTRYWSFLLKLAKDQPAWTLAAQPGPAIGPFHWDSRPLTVPEMLRLQSFPADWIVEGPRVEQVRQIGNATPPALAERLGRSIRQLLGDPVDELPALSVARKSGDVPPPAQVKPVAEKYLDLVDEHPDHPGHGRGPAPRPSSDQPARR